MAGVLVKINSLYGRFSKAERRVADYILKKAEEAPFLSVYELALATKVSVASISRFSQKTGYANFKEFKIEIAQEISSGKHIDRFTRRSLLMIPIRRLSIRCSGGISKALMIL